MRKVLLTSVIAVFSVVAVAAAAGHHGVACDSRAGSTLQEDAAARVYTAHKLIYACSRRGGSSHRLYDPSLASNSPIRDIELAGGFVGWVQQDRLGNDTVHVLRTANGDIRRVPVSSGSGGSTTQLGAYVLTAGGTLVWIKDVQPPSFDGDCTFTSTVYELKGSQTSTLKSDQNSGHCSQVKLPIASLGLSLDGTTAYWTDNGSYEGAHL